MQIYKVKRVIPSSPGFLLEIESGAKQSKCVEIYVETGAKKPNVGDRVVVLRDKYLDVEDYVYLYRGGMYLNTVPVLMDKYGCKAYLENLAGFFDCGKLDRAVFKRALRRECNRQKIPLSPIAWHNLQNIMMARVASQNKICR